MAHEGMTELEELQELEKKRILCGWTMEAKDFTIRRDLILKKHLKIMKQEVAAAEAAEEGRPAARAAP